MRKAALAKGNLLSAVVPGNFKPGPFFYSNNSIICQLIGKEGIMKDLVICFLLVFLIVTIASAQEKPKEIEIGEVVVTATRTERPVKDVPNSVTIITKEEMDRMHVKTVDDVLNLSLIHI